MLHFRLETGLHVAGRFEEGQTQSGIVALRGIHEFFEECTTNKGLGERQPANTSNSVPQGLELDLPLVFDPNRWVPMTIHVLLIVLTAAFLHALWNAIVKGTPDKTIVLGLVALGHAIPALFILLLVDFPVWAAFPFIVGSTLIHWGYYWFLNTAYKHGDLSVVYPISRGMTPVLVAIGAILFAGEFLPLFAWIGIVCISAGIGCLSLTGFGKQTNWIAVAAAFGTGLMIASYSIVDGIGIRLSQNALGYISTLFVAEIFVAGFIFTTRWRRFVALPRRYIWAGLAGGIISGLAYGLVLYAKTIAPLGVVSALRESSVIFASIIGVMWFGEGPKFNRLLAAVIVTIGILILAMAQ